MVVRRVEQSGGFKKGVMREPFGRVTKGAGMTDTTRTVRDHAFEPLECSIPDELTIAEYRNRRNGEVSPARAERRVPKRRLLNLIRR
jgi:hypothetical protein